MRSLYLIFGIDPSTAQLRVTLVDFHGVKMTGFLDDGTVIFGGRALFEDIMSLNSIITYSWMNSLVSAKPGGDLDMKFIALTGYPTTSRTDIVREDAPGAIRDVTVLLDLKLRREGAASAR